MSNSRLHKRGVLNDGHLFGYIGQQSDSAHDDIIEIVGTLKKTFDRASFGG